MNKWFEIVGRAQLLRFADKPGIGNDLGLQPHTMVINRAIDHFTPGLTDEISIHSPGAFYLRSEKGSTLGYSSDLYKTL